MEPEEPKKSETIEVRVPWRLKQDFMARARREGRSASEVIRDLMADYVRRPAQRTPIQTLETAMTMIRKRPRAGFTAVLGAAGISALIAGTLPAGAAPDLRAEFESLDADGNGVVTRQELEGGIRVDTLVVQTDGAQAGPEGHDGIGRAFMVPSTGEPGVRRIILEQTAPGPDGGAPAIDMNAHAVMVFAQGDTDGDGNLSLNEFVTRHEWTREHSFASLDANGDGVITANEAIAVDAHHDPVTDQVHAALHAIDANRDGRITRAEYEEAL